MLIMKSRITLSSFAGAVLAVSLLGCDTTPEPPQVRPPTEIREFDWGFMKFAEVRAFMMNWEKRGTIDGWAMGGLIEDGRLNKTRAPKDGIVLDAAQVEQLRKAITVAHEAEPRGYTFYPHHAFAFLDDEGKIMDYINIAFEGSHYWAEGSMAEHLPSYWDLESIENLVRDLGMPLENPQWNDED